MDSVTYRIEVDSLGEMKVPTYAYYGIQTLRAIQNFPITGIPIDTDIIHTLAEIKKAAAITNMEIHILPNHIGHAIIQAANEVVNGYFMEQFIVDSIQGGAGTSINMNMNEVLANRSLEILGYRKGAYHICSPNTHVNMSQSTNDTVPTSIKIAAFKATQQLIKTLEKLLNGLREKAQEFDGVIKMGRTHLQDAVPIRLGQEFNAYGNVIERDIKRISQASKALLTINLGATAVGTGLNASVEYIEKVTKQLSKQLSISLYTADDLVDSTQNTDCYTGLSSVLKICAINLSKMCNDIRLMASGPKTGFNEIILQPRQPGSSIMPGKVNPVMAEVVNQTAFQVIGNDHTISMASEAGQFELNVMVPVLAYNLLQSIKIMRNAVDAFYQFALVDLKANKEKCETYVNESYGIITALNPYLGYEKAAMIVKEAAKTNKTITEICESKQLLTKEELQAILDPIQMTTPNIAGKRAMIANN